MLIVSGCQKDSDVSERYQLIDKKNSVVVNNLDYWNEIKDVQIQTKDCRIMKLRFWNNPYSLDKGDKICVSLSNPQDNKIIYKGGFLSSIDVCVPHSMIDSICYPGLAIFRNGKTYHLMQKMHVDIKNSDEYLYILFMPDRGVVGGCQMISSNKFFD